MTDTIETPLNPSQTHSTHSRSQTIGKLAAALSKTQGALLPARQTKKQVAFKPDGTYAGLDDCWASARSALAENGLAISQTPVESLRPGWARLTTVLMHTSDEWIESTYSMPVEKNNSHGWASANSYMRRSAFNSVVGVVSMGEDDDGNAASGVSGPNGKPPSAPLPRKPPTYDAWFAGLEKKVDKGAGSAVLVTAFMAASKSKDPEKKDLVVYLNSVEREKWETLKAKAAENDTDLGGS